MKKVVYNYKKNINYILNKTNFYAYSFFAVDILTKNNDSDFKIDLNNVIANISDTIGKDNKINQIRNSNHQKYYSIDIKFLKEVDERYQEKAKSIIDEYNKINSLRLLKDDYNHSRENEICLNKIIKDVDDLKQLVTHDLMTIIDYVDKNGKKIDLTFLADDNLESNKLKKYYDALVLHKSVINIDNINLEMQRQEERLVNIRNFIPKVNEYMNKRKKIINSKYPKNTIETLRVKLSTILNNYIFLLTHQEFSSVKKVYEGIMKKDYDYIDQFIYTYKILIDKIWKYSLTDIDIYDFDFHYLIKYFENDSLIYIMNRKNMDSYKDTGFICNYNKDLFDAFNIAKEDLFDFPLPMDVTDKFSLSIKDNRLINKLAIYNKGKEQIANSQYIVIDIK